MQDTITFQTQIPPIWLGWFCLLIFGVLLICWLRGLRGTWLRALAALLLLVAIAEPVLQRGERTNFPDILFLVHDKTDSQTISDRAIQSEQAFERLRGSLTDIENTEIVEVEVKNDPAQPDQGSAVLSALKSAMSDVPADHIGGAVIVSDGQIHDRAALTNFPAPVHLALSGHSDDWDRRLVTKSAPAFAIVGESVELILQVENQGPVPAAKASSATIEVITDGGEERTYQVETGKDISFPVTLAHAGSNLLQIRLQALNGELTDRNNATALTINGVRDRLRVLLVSGEPYAGERTWRNLLKSDGSVDLVHFTILRPPNKFDGASVSELSLIAFPTRELFIERVHDFDLIIFDRYRRRGILPSEYLANVVDYVQDGGALLVATGPAFAGAESLFRSPLANILPARPTARVIETPYLPLVTDIGLRHPVTQILPELAPEEGWGQWLRLIETQPVSGQTLMSGVEQKPLLVLDRVGKGRIAVLTSDQAWLWSRGYQGGGPQVELMRRLAHWLMKEPELEENRLSASVMAGTISIIRRSVDLEIGPIVIEDPTGEQSSLEAVEQSPGVWVASFKAPGQGFYRISEGNIQTAVMVGPAAPKEYENSIASAQTLTSLINATGGGIIRLEDQPYPALRKVPEGRTAAGRNWFGVSERKAYKISGVTQSDLAPGWLFLLLATSLVVAAWWREGKS